MGYDYDTNDVNGLAKLIGHKIVDSKLTEDELTFTTDAGLTFHYTVEGDCCSWSYFYDIVGAEKLYENGPVEGVGICPLEEDEVRDEYGETQCYGFQIVTEHPKWGPQTTVFSFRNESNGYYGGWMEFGGITDRDGNPV